MPQIDKARELAESLIEEQRRSGHGRALPNPEYIQAKTKAAWEDFQQMDDEVQTLVVDVLESCADSRALRFLYGQGADDDEWRLFGDEDEVSEGVADYTYNHTQGGNPRIVDTVEQTTVQSTNVAPDERVENREGTEWCREQDRYDVESLPVFVRHALEQHGILE